MTITPTNHIRSLHAVVFSPERTVLTFKSASGPSVGDLDSYVFEHFPPQSANAAKSRPTKDAGKERQPKQRKHL